jgi:hypothetical protein
MRNVVDIVRVWRDAAALEDIRAAVKAAADSPTPGGGRWRAWELLLPPDLLYPMLEEVCKGYVGEWSPVVDGIGVQVGNQGEIALRFVLEGMKTSPVKVMRHKWQPTRTGDSIPVEVNRGNQVRV